MLENEKNIRLEQLNQLKGEYEAKLNELNAKNIDELVEGAVAEARVVITQNVLDEHNNAIAKAEFQLEAINEMIAKTEAEEIEVIETNENEVVENDDAIVVEENQTENQII